MITAMSAGVPPTEDALRLLLNASPDLAVLVAADGTIQAINLRAAERLGGTPDTLVGRDLFSLIPTATVAGRRAALASVLATGVPTSFDEMAGSSVLETHVLPARDDSGRIVRVAVFIRDVTAVRRAVTLQQALLAISEAAQTAPDLPGVFAGIHLAVAGLMDAKNFYIALHDAESGLLSFPYFVDEYDPAPDPKPLGRGLTEYVLRHGAPLLASPEEFAALQASGEIEPLGAESVDWLGVPLQADGVTLGVLAIQTYTPGVRYTEHNRDLLVVVARQVASAIQRARDREHIRNSEESYRTLVEHIQDVMYRWDSVSDQITWNQNLSTVFGVPPSAMSNGAAFLERVHPEDQDTLTADLARRRRLGGRYECEVRLRRGDGNWATVMDRGAALTDPEGRVVSLVGILVDVSQREQAARQRAQVQRMEALGHLAGGISHDFNNLLQAVQGAVGLLQRLLPPGSQGLEEAAVIERAAQRGADLTRALLAFARRQHLETRRLDLHRSVREILPVLRRLFPENIAIHHFTDGQPGTVVADTGALEQILINLAVNSRDAMPAGGTLTISTANTALGNEFLSRKPWGDPGAYVRLTVADTGCGMDERALAHLFEPFFSTKPPGKGTGMGLATVYGIVKQHGGLVDISSQAGKGTQVDVYLPLVDQPPEPAEPAEPPPGPGKGELVLVVEDEPEVRRILVHALQALEYRVLEAADGLEALAVLARTGHPPDLVLTDVVMPRMGGLELMQRIRGMHPSVRFLFSSGYSSEDTEDTGTLGATVGFLTKPYTLDQLASRVRAALDTPGDDQHTVSE